MPPGREAQPGAPGVLPGRWAVHAERGGVAAGWIGTVNVGPGRPAVRSAYRKQVERIAPPELVGREAELQELAAYCTEPGRGPYVWWQAPAWAGKSALLSTFVLHPPTGVRVVAFFITARLGAQDTREAFTEVVLEQLAELLGQDLPPMLTAATWDAHLLGMLEQAAEACAVQGERLILVVDGLDEDRSIAAGQEAYSIAALLPHDPPAGMRVVVAGRSDPPIPDDVPGWHRLRDGGIIRPLAPSAYAQDIKTLAQQELKRLLRGTPAQQDLLGLLTSARGGLSGPDLAALTGEPPWEVEDILHGLSGRTFTTRVSMWQPESGPEVYLLGHEELQATALKYLSGQRLADYQNRLHAWAQDYRARDWPIGTPEYLLRGYFQMLTATGDTARLAACAADAARHERMLGITGGDAAALNEVTVTLNLISAQDNPDLTGALKLVRHRDYLADRNANIPTQLPAVWATLGHRIRAEALARSITDPYDQVKALAALAGALAWTGQPERAAAAAAWAETVARSLHAPHPQAQALVAVAGALARAGQHEQAVTVARSILDPYRQAQALAAVAGVLAGVGQHQQAAALAAQAETAARGVAYPGERAGALVAVAGALARAGRHEQAAAVAHSTTPPEPEALAAASGALARAGRHEQAAALAAQAETAAMASSSWPDRQAKALAAVAGALARAGQYEQAAAVAAKAETVARSITGPHDQAMTLVAVAEALARAGQHEQAVTVARSIYELDWQARALAAVAGVLARAGQHEQAAALAAQAETAARSIASPDPKALWAVARGLARAGQHQQAAIVARSIDALYWQAWALAGVAEELARAGQHQQAAAVAAQAEAAVRSFPDPDMQEVLVALAGTLARSGRRHRAAIVARSIDNPWQQARALAAAAGALAGVGQHKRAAAVAARATTVALSVPHPYQQVQALAAAAEALARAGQHKRAAAVAARSETVARSITDPDWQAEALAAAAEALARAGQHQQAATVAHSITDPYQQAKALAAMAEALARAGQHQQAATVAARAETVARSITGSDEQAEALAALVGALARAGQHQQATAVAARAETVARSITSPDGQAEALVAMAEELAARGDTRHARHLTSAACAVGRWTTVLGPVLSLEPSAVSVLAGL